MRSENSRNIRENFLGKNADFNSRCCLIRMKLFVPQLLLSMQLGKNKEILCIRVVSRYIFLLSLFCGTAAKMWFYAAAKMCFQVRQSLCRKTVAAQKNKKLYTKIYFDTTLIYNNLDEISLKIMLFIHLYCVTILFWTDKSRSVFRDGSFAERTKSSSRV